MATLGKSSTTIDTGGAIDVTPGNKSGLFAPGVGLIDVPTLIDIPGMLGLPSDLGLGEIDTPPIEDIATAIDTSYEGYFTRAIIIILGFIFVAVGLTMFSGKTIIVEGTRNG